MNQNDMVRDPTSKALLSTDRRAVEEYRKRRANAKVLSESLNSLKAEVTELRSILQKLIEERSSK